jgi:hypothetical protein
MSNTFQKKIIYATLFGLVFFGMFKYTMYHINIKSIEQEEESVKRILEKTFAQLKKENKIAPSAEPYVRFNVEGNDLELEFGYYHDSIISSSYKELASYEATDYEIGKYTINASPAMLSVTNGIEESLRVTLKKYLTNASDILIETEGGADITPIRGTIRYKGEWGTISQPYYSFSKRQALNFNKENRSRVTSNEELSFLRGYGVYTHLLNIFQDIYPENMNIIRSRFVTNVANERGSKHRKVLIKIHLNNAL